MALVDFSNEQLTEQLQEHGGVIRALARSLEVSPSSLSERLSKAGITHNPAKRSGSGSGGRPSGRPLPTFTLADIHQGMEPPNNCRVKIFMEALDEASREAFAQALEYNNRDLSARRLREILIDRGFKDAEIPGVDAINSHKAGTRPCRCKG